MHTHLATLVMGQILFVTLTVSGPGFHLTELLPISLYNAQPPDKRINIKYILN